jgi:HK97 family phage major capsid protein
MNTLEASANDAVARAEQLYSELLSTVESRIASLPDTATVSDVDTIQTEFRSRLDAAEASIAEARKRAETAQRITEARAASQHLIPNGDVRVTDSPTYDPRNPERSFVSDLWAAQRMGSREALDRLQRNNREVVASRIFPGSSESRATLTTADFYPPAYLAHEYVTSHRARMVFAGLVEQHDLPPYGTTVTIPAYTAPTDSTNPQGGDNAAIQTAAGTTSQLTAPITSYAGYVDVARQAIERALPGLDKVIFGDLSRDIGRKIEIACLNGSGSNQPLGILQEGTVPSVTVSGQTAAQLLLKVADIAQRVETAVGEQANFIVMAPRRYSWLASLLDSQNRPLIVPVGAGPNNAFGTLSNVQRDDDLAVAPDLRPSGYFMGLPVYTSPSLPLTLGAGTNEDWLIVGASYMAARWSDPQGIREFAFDSVASSTGSIRLQAWHYGSFKVRYPSAFGIVKGMTVPVF